MEILLVLTFYGLMLCLIVHLSHIVAIAAITSVSSVWYLTAVVHNYRSHCFNMAFFIFLHSAGLPMYPLLFYGDAVPYCVRQARETAAHRSLAIASVCNVMELYIVRVLSEYIGCRHQVTDNPTACWNGLSTTSEVSTDTE